MQIENFDEMGCPISSELSPPMTIHIGIIVRVGVRIHIDVSMGIGTPIPICDILIHCTL